MTFFCDGYHWGRLARVSRAIPTTTVAADVSRLKLSSLTQLFECLTEKNDPAHARCYKNVAADVSRLKLSNFVRLFACPAENNDPAHAGCYEKRRA